MLDTVLIATLLLSFATGATAHGVLLVRLFMRMRPRWRALWALVLPPLAPLWGLREGFRRTALLWIAALVMYVAARVAAG